jgi:hypothetical protein
VGVREELEKVRAEIERLNFVATEPEWMDRLDFVQVGNGYHVFYFGSEALHILTDTLTKPLVSEALLSISLSAPDRGVNGTNNWNISALADTPSQFPRLRSFKIAQNNPGDHNGVIIGDMYEERGMVTRFLAKAPAIAYVTLPSAPNQSLFDLPLKQLEYLNIDVGLDAQGFIQNMARMNPISTLRFFAWGEYCQIYMENWRDLTTSFDDMLALFRAAVFDSVRVCHLKNSVYSASEIATLHGVRPNIQLKLIRAASEYSRNPRRS